MKKFDIETEEDFESSPFDRQKRITWWEQDKIKNAKVMVVGAGALGNETLKNLALLGFRNIFIVDFDEVSNSNLSRTVLFRGEDIGKIKAKVAAERTKELSPLEDMKVDWFHGDIVWDLGTSIYKEMDIVLGCLDNLETRFHVNRQCWLTNTPWIDAGIHELAGRVSTFIPPNGTCFECGASKKQLEATRRKRYSCDNFKKKMLNEGKVPTVQITSAIISALQVQEAVKYLNQQNVQEGTKIFFQGTVNDFDVIKLKKNPNCLAHASYPDPISIPLGQENSLKNFLELISQDEYSKDGATLDLSGERDFIIYASCKRCNEKIDLYKPSFNIYDTDVICNECIGNNEPIDIDIPVNKEAIYTFNLKDTENKILNMTLKDIGIPIFHIVAVIDNEGSYKYYSLDGDKSILLENILKG